MNKATPVQMRTSLMLVSALKHGGIRFVPMPVLDEKDYERQVVEMNHRLERMASRLRLRKMAKARKVNGCPAFPGNGYAPKEWCYMNRHDALCLGRCDLYVGLKDERAVSRYQAAKRKAAVLTASAVAGW